MGSRLEPAMMSLVLLVLSCRTKPGADDTGDLLGPRDTFPHTGLADSTPDTGSKDTGPIEAVPFELPVSCPHEDPPTVFTGGLVWVHSLQPYDGAYSFEIEGYIVAREQGEVDWDAGTLTATREHITGYNALSSTSTSTFTLDAYGDYTMQSTAQVSFANGTVAESSSSSTKTGCVGVSEILDTDTGVTVLNTHELVSPTQRDWVEQKLAADGVTLLGYSEGVIVADWTDTYTFEVYDPNTAIAVDYEGDCTKWGDGHRECDTTSWSEGGYLLNNLHWYPDGSSDADWESHETDSAINPTAWGRDEVDYDQSGTRVWTFWDKAAAAYVDCSGTWDSAREGTWSCSNGAAGTWADKT